MTRGNRYAHICREESCHSIRKDRIGQDRAGQDGADYKRTRYDRIR